MRDAPASDRPKRAMKADLKLLAELVGQRHKSDLDHADPIFLVATIVEEVVAEAQKTTLAEVEKLVTGLADQVAAAGAMAENAATAKAEKIVTQATDWATRKITDAGETVSARILADRQQVQADAAVAAQRLRWATIAAVVCSVAALSAAVSTGVAMWVG